MEAGERDMNVMKSKQNAGKEVSRMTEKHDRQGSAVDHGEWGWACGSPSKDCDSRVRLTM